MNTNSIKEVSNLIELEDEVIMARMTSLACNKANVQNLPLVMLDSQEIIIQAYIIKRIKALKPLILEERRTAPEFFFNQVHEDTVDEILGLDLFLQTAACIDTSFSAVFGPFAEWSDILYGIQWSDADSKRERKEGIQDARERASLERYLQTTEECHDWAEEIRDQNYLLYDWHDQIKGVGQTYDETGCLIEPMSDYYAPLLFQPKPRWYNKAYKSIKDNQNGLLIGMAVGFMATFCITGVVMYANTPTFGPEFLEPSDSEFDRLLSRLE